MTSRPLQLITTRQPLPLARVERYNREIDDDFVYIAVKCSKKCFSQLCKHLALLIALLSAAINRML